MTDKDNQTTTDKSECKKHERECTDDELRQVDLLLKILRSGNLKTINALSIMMNQIARELD